MARAALAVIPLLAACGGPSDPEVFCGTLSHDREVWVQGGLVPAPTSRDLCLTYDSKAQRLVSDDELGQCLFQGDPAEGACYTTAGATQTWVHPTTTLVVEREVNDDSDFPTGSLGLSGEARTSEWDTSTVVYGLGELTFQGTLQPVGEPVELGDYDLPACDLSACQTGAWNMTQWSGPDDCQEVIDRNQDVSHTFWIDAQTRDFVIDDVPTLAHRDTGECAWHMARDGNAFNIWNYTLTDGRVTANQVERWTTTGGSAVVCNISYEAVLSGC